MNAEELLFKKFNRRPTTWRKVKEDINKNFFYLTEEDRHELAELWDKLSSSKEFGIRKSRDDKSSDDSIYFDLAGHFIDKLERIKGDIGY
mgnify:CR=1 FL=1